MICLLDLNMCACPVRVSPSSMVAETVQIYLEVYIVSDVQQSALL